ncbi:MAG TPA: hypothetical protein VKA10_02520 [Prolixibacteraceae bacterium]|nr:hypothetical protein [Prolixibacteraceae bacterium]
MKSFFSFLSNQLNLGETFYHPDKRIPGNWILYEYYTEPGNKLIHVNKASLETENRFMRIEFSAEGNFYAETNINAPSFLSGSTNLKWTRKRNYILLYEAGFPDEKIELQFAFQKKALRLLNKDTTGRIQFFGFFNKPEALKKK